MRSMRTVHARLVAILSALLLAAPLASAQGPARQVIDDVGFWSDAAKAKANQQIAEIKRLFNKDLVIEAATAPKLPASIDTGDKSAVNGFYDRWSQHRYEELGVNGIYVVVVPSTHKIRYDVGRAAQAGHFFTLADGRELVTQISPLLAKNPDDALGQTVQFVEARMKENHAASPIGAGQHAQRVNPVEHGGGVGAGHGDSGSGWAILWTIVGLAIVAWIVIAVVRSIGGMGRGGAPGYGGGGYGGGGGGGFFSNMLGGLFGAAAGMYLYNSFFGHGNSAWGAGSGGGDYGSSTDPNAGDATATGGGGDYGDNGGNNGGDNGGGGGGDWGGGDAGGGGGDWGGGGGDFGGGGGDFGGGGGGDW